MRTAARITLLAVVVALCGLTIACKGSRTGSPTAGSVQQYFQQVALLDGTASRRIEEIAGLLETPPADGNNLTVVRQYLTEIVSIDSDLRDGLQEIAPPSEARDAHTAAIDALSALIEIAKTAADPANDNPIGEISSAEARAANADLAAACEGLNGLAQSHGVTVELTCAQ
jgi:hypothetical protein